MKKEFTPRIFVCGHRNPDIDSIAAAVALADLRRRQGMKSVTAICPGILPDRAAYLFKRFHLEPPMSRNDVYVRVRDILETVPAIRSGCTLYDAVGMLRDSGLARLPVIDGEGKFLGMLSGMALLTNLLSIGNDVASTSLTGRRIKTSISLISQVLDAEQLNVCDGDRSQTFEVYVAAMSPDVFDEHLPENNHELAMIVGDRPDIQLKSIARKMRLMIVTGNRPIDPWVLQGAKAQGVSILQTKLDSATVIRRLKFSVPVEFTDFPQEALILTSRDRMTEVKVRILNAAEDVIPVVDDGILTGVVLKRAFHAPLPFQMILVDHNELDQSIAGAGEIPVIEVVDHHRIGINPTTTPIKFTGDVVGSTCTLVAMMYRASGESLTPDMAGLLLGGIISDTLQLKSPTTAHLDVKMCEWLEKISGVRSNDLMSELLMIESALVTKSADDVISGDRKDYVDGRFRFALAQVEETNLELLQRRHDELVVAMDKQVKRDQLSMFALLVTDAARGNSELLVYGDRELISNLPYDKISDGHYALPGVLSRKKQLLPQILAITAALQNKSINYLQ
ncbi:MAG: putative manganese-dependent inorganic diphosphatase [Lentisphaeria bacterium]|nr:putative manganese-dependent inorganic diphosphatase [Lentisphaeria bacterium]